MLVKLTRFMVSDAWSVHDAVRVPGLLSLSRLALAALFPLTLGHPWSSLAALATAGATDVLDGWYARRFHEESVTGAALDGLADKVFVLSVVISLLAAGSLSIVEVLLLGTRDIGELALAIRLRLGRRPLFGRSANVSGKIATALQYGAIIAILFESSQRATFIGLVAFAGFLATVAYWRRDVEGPSDATPVE